MPSRGRPFVKKSRNQFQEWTAQDDKMLRERYGPDGAQVVATAMNRSRFSVYVRASKLGLKKGPGATASYHQAAVTREAEKREGSIPIMLTAAPRPRGFKGWQAARLATIDRELAGLRADVSAGPADRDGARGAGHARR